MPPHSNEEDLLASLQFVSRSIEDASSLGSLDDDDEQATVSRELVPLLHLLVQIMKKKEDNRKESHAEVEESPTTTGRNLSASEEPTVMLEGIANAKDCREQAADVLTEIQAMVVSEIDAWKEHCGRCSTLKQAGVPRADKCIELEKEILQEYEKLQKQVESCFHGIQVKTDGKLLLPHEKQMALWLDKIQDLETRLKEKEEKEDILETRLKEKEDREKALHGEVASLRKTLGQKELKISEFESKFLEAAGAFGASAWSKYFGDVGDEPPLPSNIIETMESPCPFSTGKKTRETHLLVLIPATVNGQPFSLDLLLETLIQNPQNGGNKTCYEHYHWKVKNHFGYRTVERSYWILITREILVDSKNKEYKAQEALMAQYNQSQTRTGVMEYKVSSALEATTAVLTNYVRSGEVLPGGNVYTHCEERINDNYRVLVGYLGTNCIKIAHVDAGSFPTVGMMACCAWKED